MSKKPKKKQTEWNIQGKQIADTAVPLYQTNLNNIANFDTQRTMDDYISKYYDNTTEQSDFIRNYNRAMSEATAQNYAATGGGYDTSNQRMYDDQQRYMNDWAARLRDKGVVSGYNMANNDYNNLLAANSIYRNAYALGQPYSDVDQYNYQVKQHNSFGNQLAGIVGGVGSVLSTIPTPVTQGLGAAMQIGGNAFSLQDPTAGSSSDIRAAGSGIGSNMYTNIGRGLAGTAALGGDNWITRLYGGANNPLVTQANQSLADRLGYQQINTSINPYLR